MSGLTLRWRQPTPLIETRWAGPTREAEPIAVRIGPPGLPGHHGEPGPPGELPDTIDGGNF